MTPTRDRPRAPRSLADLRPPWWREVLLVVGFYLLYSFIRNQFGSASVGADVAYDNARRVMDLERSLRLFLEPEIQQAFIDWRPFLWFWNVHYGSLHFVVTWGILAYLFWKQPHAYPRWRTIGLATTGVALVGFAAFPLMPPRLLGSCRDVGACVSSPFTDTMAEIGGLWSFDSGTMEQISNQYAAMPSLHFAWAVWSWLALRPHVGRLGRTLLALHPWITLFAIVVTANHYWIDAAGGALALAFGFAVARTLHGPFGERERRSLDLAVVVAPASTDAPSHDSRRRRARPSDTTPGTVEAAPQE